MIKELFARWVYEPLYEKLYRRENTLEYYSQYKRMQWDTLDENRKFQAKKLYEILKYSCENIPYYKNVKEKKDIPFSEETIFGDIKKFPVLTKDIIRKEMDNLQNLKRGWHLSTSGGSTGEPLKFIQDSELNAHLSAMTRIQYEWANYYLGERMVTLWGSKKDFFNQKGGFHHKFADWMKSNYWLNSFKMDDRIMEEYVGRINKIRPKFILAYAQSMNELAKFITRKKMKVHKPRSIMTSASVLPPSYRKNIEDAYSCPVFNRYGSREVGNTASECEKHEGLHVSIFTHYVEILDKHMKPCKEGEMGDIYITLLNNYSMPLIRYKIGDMAIYTEKTCSCKRGLPLIRDIAGRDNDMFITNKGELLHTAIINMQFYYKDFLKRYQVIQKSKTELFVKLSLTKKYDKEYIKKELKIIESDLKKVMGEECIVKFKVVKEIKPTKSGKFRFTIREF